MKTQNFLSGSSTVYSPMIVSKIHQEDNLLLGTGKIISLDAEGKCECRKIPCQDCADASLMNQFEKIDFELISKKLTRREFYVIAHYYGVNLYEEKSIQEIADDLGETVEAISSIKEGAIEKMRKMRNAIFLN